MKHDTWNPKVKKILFGGDYNPEQWPEEVWEADMKLLKEAHINELTLNVFSWASLQPSEDTYDFSKLDRIMKLAKDNGFSVMLATSTAATPPWMAARHPDILRTDADGMKRKYGARHNFCPSSPTMRKYAPLLAQKLAEHYRDYDNIVAWHIGNEYGGACYCDNCQKKFRGWLKDKYKTLDELNRAWNTSFWSHIYYDWDEIVLPDFRSENFLDGTRLKTQVQPQMLDYRRFNSENILEEYRLEYEAVKKVTPDIPVTTNLMWFFYDLNYREWARYMDFISWDCYPSNETEPAELAMAHDLMRGLGHQKPFVLMEQTPSVTNWQPYNELKRPGGVKLLSFEAMAHGADAIQFFQMRRSRGACEALHGAVIDHIGLAGTRAYNEVEEIGNDLEQIGDQVMGATTPSKAAIIFDWESWWAVDASAGPSYLMDYKAECINYYRAFYNQHIPVDVIGVDDDFTAYDIVIAPMLFMIQDGFEKKVTDFVAGGGRFVTTFMSGLVDKNYLFYQGGYPKPLREVLGLWMEEQDALPSGKENHFTYGGKEYPAKILCDIVHPLSDLRELIAKNKEIMGDIDYFKDSAYQISETAGDMTAIGSYTDDFYKGMPAVTDNAFGKGHAYYVATSSSKEFYTALVGNLCKEVGISPVACDVPEGIEVTVRENENGRFIFYLNHNDNDVVIRDSLGRSLLK